MSITDMFSSMGVELTKKYDPAIGSAVKAYVLVQFVLVLVAGIALLAFPDIGYAVKALCVAMILFTMITTCHWLDARAAAPRLDRVRSITLGLLTLGAWLLGWPLGLCLLLALYALLNLLVLAGLRQPQAQVLTGAAL